MKPILLAGTDGYSIWFSDNLGESFTRLLSDSGLYSESRIYAMTSDPADPGRVLIGTDSGLYQFEVAKSRFSRVESFMNGLNVWSIAFASSDPSLVLAGTRKPAGVFRSTDGGRTWAVTQAESVFPQTCAFVITPRVTRIQFSPDNAQNALASIELGGVWGSTDGGQTWNPKSQGLISDDVHDICHWQGRLFATTNHGLHTSDDGAETWVRHSLDLPGNQYLRSVHPLRSDPNIMFLGGGDGPPGSIGYLLRSVDAGTSWVHVDLPIEPQSTIYAIASSALNTSLLFAMSTLGQIYRSEDKGLSWCAMPRRICAIRSLAVVYR